MNELSRRSNHSGPRLLFGIALFFLGASTGLTQDIPEERQILPIDTAGVQLVRQGRRLIVHADSEPADRSISIPRIYASLVRIHFSNEAPHDELTVNPEPKHWLIRWKPTVTFQNTLILEFDGPPLLASETIPISQAGDGTLTFHAFQAITTGEKLRYEPQPHKNTVGYWTVPTDFPTWKLYVDRPGEFNVGILQGCGKGQGGSEGEIIISSDSGGSSKLDFTTVDTGHFQNFIWRDLGKIQIESEGVFDLIIKPKRIAKAALMDVRMLHLSPARQ